MSESKALTREIEGKTCDRCGEFKALSLFGVNYVTRTPCGSCKVCRVIQNRPSVLRWRERNKDKIKLYEMTKRQARKFDPVKQRVRWLTRYYIKSGKLKKPDACSICHENKTVQAHHHDYSKPLEVEWLCAQCHGMQHRKC